MPYPSDQHEAAAVELLEKHKEKLPPWCGYNTENLTELPVGKGWAIILRCLCNKINWIKETYGITVKVAQVKEKFGGLRFYLDGIDIDPEWIRTEEDGSYTWLKNCGRTLTNPEENFNVERIYSEFRGAIGMAESMCYNTCEDCGRPGKYREAAWVRVQCAECWAPHEEEARKSREQYEADMKELQDGKETDGEGDQVPDRPEGEGLASVD
jgi:hypothetical protein